jgi:uncharacterized protein (TIGR03435 family)
MTMQALATRLSRQLHAPVTDATGLTGQYEISVYWATDTGLRTAPLTGRGNVPQADGDVGPDIDAGTAGAAWLRLKSKKSQVDFLVIDHAEKVPTEN